MKIVIDIPEEIYDTIMDDQMLSREQLAILQHHIYYGQPLPKGHGRLIDADELKTIRSIQNKYANFNSIETIQEWIDHAPTIIEKGDEQG